MPNAAEHFRSITQEIDTHGIKNAQEAGDELRRVITDTQQLTLSQMNDSVSRQLGSILFSHEAGLIAALSAMREPEITREKPPKRFTSASLFGAGLIALAAAFALCLQIGEYLICVFMGVALALSGMSTFWPRKQAKVTVTQTVDATELFQLAEKRMEAIDRDLDAFLQIPHGDADDDEGVLHLITKAVSLKREDPDSIPDELMTAITALTLSRGYTLAEYGEETERYFDAMPTRRETRTIVPAVLKGERLIARGMAIVTMNQQAAEDE